MTIRLARHGAFAALAALVAVGAAAQVATAAAREGDAQRGEAIYGRCAACHALGYDRTGPRHCGLLGRRAGSVAGFDYSPAMKQANIVWTPASLDRFLADPPGTVPGTTMGYAGIDDAGERADLIAFLQQADTSSECRNSPGKGS